MPARWIALAVIAALTIAGCGEATYKVAGTVTFDGKPVESGSIAFEAADGGPGVAASGITAGKYELQCKAGKRKIMISAFRVRPGTENDPQPTMDSYIPSKYNDQTELVEEVKPISENRINFELKK